MPVSIAEELFHTVFHVFHHKRRTDLALIRATKPHSLPAELAQHIDVVGVSAPGMPQEKGNQAEEVPLGAEGVPLGAEGVPLGAGKKRRERGDGA